MARVEEQAANLSEDIPQLREEATTAYRALIAHIEAHNTLGTAPEYSVLLEQVSVLAGQYNQVIENRSSSDADTDNDDTPTEDTTPPNDEQ